MCIAKIIPGEIRIELIKTTRGFNKINKTLRDSRNYQKLKLKTKTNEN